jgi:enediyne polyketide synthase
VLARARARGVPGARLPVSHAFHSPLVAGAAPVLRACLEREELRPLERRVLSTVTGAELPRDEDLRALLVRQVTAPVLFADALAAAAAEVDLFVETGPGTVLTRLASEQAGVPVLPLDAGGPRLRPLLVAAGAAFALGAPIRPMALFEDRLTRPCPAGWRPRFLENPCEQAPAGPAPAAARAPAPRAGARVPEAVADPSGDPLALVRELVARRVELPVAAVGEGLRLLDDLHLNSIAVGELVAAAARLLGVAPPAAPQDYAHATVAEIATALREARESGARGTEAPAAPPGVDTWTRAFAVEEVERPLPHVPARTGSGRWTVLAPAGHALAEELRRQAGPPAVIVCLPPAPDERHLALLLDGARRAAALPDEPRLVLVQHGGGAASWARTFHQEHANATTVVLDLPEGDPRAAERVRAELEAAAGWVEARYDERGARLEPVLRLVPDDGARGPLPIGATDVLLVTGGGKGIAAESALALGRASGARVVLLGRSDPARDPGLAAAFERLTKLGLAHRYARADLTDADAVRAAVRAVEAEWGPVTAVLHGAGTNEPRLLEQLDEAAVRRTLAPKVGGLEHVLAAVDPARLRLLVAFGSVIARTGMRGEADYALANEWLTRAVERFAERHPACRALSVEWSVWSGVGMAERLGRVDALLAQGITPITADAGVALLLDLLRRPLARASVVATGRLGNPPTLRLETPELPVLRFLERVRVHVPGVELVAEARLSEAQDPYVADHVYRSSALFPAVLGLEAMAQAASALAGRRDPPVLDRVVLARPVTVPRGGARVVRLAALVRGPGAVEVTLRSEETGFQAEHFGAIARWVAAGPPPAPAAAAPPGPAERVALDPRRDLYGGLFFQGARFQRVVGYRLLRARECVAEVAVAPPAPWFGDYLPQTLLLGDPAVRDAALHSVQSSIPQAVVLPVAVGRIVRSGAPSGGTVLAQARERSGDGKSFVYDLRVTDPDGRELERWEGLELRAMERSALPGAWPPALLGPYVERRLDELVPGHGLSVVVERNGARSDAALGRALGGEGAVLRRPDGKPEAADGRAVSAAHGDGLTLAVSGRAPLSCDLEPVSARASGTWRDLLGAARFELSRLIADEAREAPDAAATRVWTAAECLKKAGLGVDTPLGLESREPDGWVLLRAGGVRVATLVASAGTIENRLAFAVLVPPRA